MRVFDRTGERRNRRKARLKFVLMRIGVEEFRRLVREELASMPAADSAAFARPDLSREEGPPVQLGSADGTPPGEGYELWREVNVLPQRQDGYHAVQVSLPTGAITAEQFAELASICHRFCGGPPRTTIEQNLLLRWVPEADLAALHRSLVAAGLARPTAGTILDPVACPGAETCMSAITNSKALARAVIEEFSQDGYLHDPLARRARIKLGGCPNACGHHHVADLGLHGCALHVGERLLPAYQLLIGGGDGARLAQPVMKIPARRVPAALRALVDHYREARTAEEHLPDFVRRIGAQGVRDALAEYGRLPSFAEDPTAYVDWEGDKLFSLDERGEGECAV